MGEKKLRGALTSVVLALTAMLAQGTTGATATAAEGTPEPAPHYFTSDGQDTAQALRNLVELNAIPSQRTGWGPSANPPITDDKACPASRCRDYALPRPAGVSVTRPVVRVLLPVGYSTETARRYPVVYLFNGSLSPY